MEQRQTLSIRQFANVCGVSHTEIARKMRELGIEGQPQGKGLPTLLSEGDQDKIASALVIPLEPTPAPAVEVEVIGGGLSVYTPAPLATRGTDSSLSRHLQTQQLSHSVQGFKANQASFRDALLAMATEQGRQLGHEMQVSMMNAAMAQFGQLQTAVGNDLGVVAQPTPAPSEPA